nr:unnamed protein product [Callosobruchus analis]
MKNKIRFVNGYKVQCCDQPTNSEFCESESEEVSLLEQTISELKENSLNRDNYIKKIKNNHQLFIDEAMKTESELKQLLEQQKMLVNELSKIDMLQKEVYKNRIEKENTSTQTDTVKKADKFTEINSPEDFSSGVRDKLTIIDELSTMSTSVQHEMDRCPANVSPPIDVTPGKRKNLPRILICGDEYARSFRKLLDLYIDKTFEVEALVQPNIEFSCLTKEMFQNMISFGSHNYVVVMINTSNISSSRSEIICILLMSKKTMINMTNFGKYGQLSALLKSDGEEHAFRRAVYRQVDYPIQGITCSAAVPQMESKIKRERGSIHALWSFLYFLSLDYLSRLKHSSYRYSGGIFDNQLELLDKAIFVAITVRANRLDRCPLKSESDPKKTGRGSCDYLITNDKKFVVVVVVVRWYDSKAVNMVSSFVGIEPEDEEIGIKKKENSDTTGFSNGYFFPAM